MADTDVYLRETPDERNYKRGVSEHLVTGKRKWKKWKTSLSESEKRKWKKWKTSLSESEVVQVCKGQIGIKYSGQSDEIKKRVMAANEAIEKTPKGILATLAYEAHRGSELEGLEARLTKMIINLKKEHDSKMKKQDGKIKKQEDQIKKQDSKMKKQEDQIKKQEDQIKKQDGKMKKQDGKIKKQEDQIKKQDSEIKWLKDRMAVLETFPMVLEKIEHRFNEKNSGGGMYIEENGTRVEANVVQIVAEVKDNCKKVIGISEGLRRYIEGEFRRGFGGKPRENPSLDVVLAYLKRLHFARRQERNVFAHPRKRSTEFLEQWSLLKVYLSKVDEDDKSLILEARKVANIYKKLKLSQL